MITSDMLCKPHTLTRTENPFTQFHAISYHVHFLTY